MIWSEDVEKSILGSILVNEQCYDEAVGLGLQAEDFSLDSHQRIFRHFGLLANSSAQIDIVTLTESLATHRELERIGDPGYIADLVQGIPYRTSIRSHIKVAKEYAAKRALHRACDSMVHNLEAEMSANDAVEYLGEQILQVQIGNDDKPAKRVFEFSESTYSKWLEVAEGTSNLIGLTTGLDCLDTATTGIRPQELWVIGGRTGDGKTNLALQMAAENCVKEIPVALFSIEMPKESILHRLWAGEAKVDFNHIRFPRRLSPEVKMRIERAMCEVAKWPLHIVDQGGIQLSKLVAKAKLLIRKERVKLIIVDYVQIVTCAGKDERERVSRISKTLQALAKDTGVPVIALSQLSRPKDGNENNRPVKYSLKESGSLENDPDVIVLIYRPVDDRKMKTREDELIIEKQRSGLPSIEKVCFLPWLRFAERETQ